MLRNEAQAATPAILLSPVSAANTAAATGGWVDVRQAEGDIMVQAQVGALTGSITWTLQTASDGSGTGSTGITPNEGAFAAGAANQVQKRTLSANATLGWIRLVGTIVTGPALVAGTAAFRTPHAG
ncbi:MAG: hypothetical protein KDF67_19510 [Ottowia sp.]|nr:hypothetical protein [Ottowia sp.]